MYQLERERSSGKTAVHLVIKDRNEMTSGKVLQLAIIRTFTEFFTTFPFSNAETNIFK